MDRKKDELDKILEEGLATYSNGEPWPGLEERILSRVAAAGARKRRIWWWAIVALPAAVCLILVLSGIWRKQEIRPAGRAPQVAASSRMLKNAPAHPLPDGRGSVSGSKHSTAFLNRAQRAPRQQAALPLLSESPAPQKQAPPKHVAAKKSLPRDSQVAKREQFPSPAPLSSEERALISLAMAAPGEQPTPGEPAPLEVEPIQIEPLQVSGPSEEKNQ